MASKILCDHGNSNSNIKRKNAESDPEAFDESRKRVKQDPGDASQTVPESKTDSPCLGVLTSWKEPPLQHVSESCTLNIVFFDLETTSLRLDCDITQISAVLDKEIFNEYVVPQKMIDPVASQLTGITCYDGILYHNGIAVQAFQKKAALENFLAWIEAHSPILMFAHNAHFDYKRLFHALQSQDLADRFSSHIVGFVDTLTLFRKKFPNMINYKQETLAKKILDKKYACHDSLEDVKILQELYLKSKPHSFHKHSCTFISAYNKWLYSKRAGKNKNTFSKMVKDGILTTRIATKLANSGLCRADLQNICKKSGETELLTLLSETDKSGQPRVPKSEKIVGKICQYFQGKQRQKYKNIK